MLVGIAFFQNEQCREMSDHVTIIAISSDQWHTQEFCSGGGGVQQIHLRTEDRENGDLGAVAP